MKLRTPLAILAVFVAGPALAQAADAPMTFGVVYECKGAPDFVIKGCGREMCPVQNLNAAAPDGHGALLDYYKGDQMNARLRGCTATANTEDTPKPDIP